MNNRKLYAKRMIVLILSLLMQSMVYANSDQTAGCPNGNPCPDGKCNIPQPAAAGGSAKECQDCSRVGDPIDVGLGILYEFKTDFSLPVKHGLSLDVTRQYSTNILHDGDNQNGDYHFTVIPQVIVNGYGK